LVNRINPYKQFWYDNYFPLFPIVGYLFNLVDGPGEAILKPENFGLPLHCVFLRPLDDEDLTLAPCEPSPDLPPAPSSPQRHNKEHGDSAANTNTGALGGEIGHLKNAMRKKDERIGVLLRAVVTERREKHRLEREKQNLVQNIEKVFNANQLARLGRKSGRGVKWSTETVEKAQQLRMACGVKGYMMLRAQNQPLPSLRCLRKLSPLRRNGLDRVARRTTGGRDSLQGTIGAKGAYTAMAMP